MLNLRYRNQRMAGNGGRTGVAGPGPSSLQRLGLVLGWVILPYAWQRGVGALVRLGWHHLDPTASLQGRIAWLIPRLEAIVRGASFLNAVVFLRWGEYRSLLERVLATRLVYDRPVMARAVSFDYLNRQLVWAQVSELFLFLLPLLDSRRGAGVLRGWVKGMVGYMLFIFIFFMSAVCACITSATMMTTTIIHRCTRPPASIGAHHSSSSKQPTTPVRPQHNHHHPHMSGVHQTCVDPICSSAMWACVLLLLPAGSYRGGRGVLLS